MSKLVLKTVGITLACIILTAGVLFCAFLLFSPKTLGSVSDSFGNYNACIYFYTKQYEKTKSIDDLYTLVCRLDEEKDSSRTEIYSSEMISHGEFLNLCARKDQGKKGSAINTKDYSYGKLAIAYVNNQKVSIFITMGRSYVHAYGYTEYNPFRKVVAEKSTVLSENDKTLIKFKLNLLKNESERTQQEKDYIQKDINDLN